MFDVTDYSVAAKPFRSGKANQTGLIHMSLYVSPNVPWMILRYVRQAVRNTKNFRSLVTCKILDKVNLYTAEVA